MNTFIVNTKVQFQNKMFEISTCNKESNFHLSLGELVSETLVFTLNDLWVRGECISETYSEKNSISAHQTMVKRLHETGSPQENYSPPSKYESSSVRETGPLLDDVYDHVAFMDDEN